MYPERITGLIIVLVGVGIIGYALYSSLQIFTGKVEPPELFSETQMPAKPKADSAPAGDLQNLQEQLGNLLGEQLESIVPINVVPRTLNLSMWSVFVGLLIFGGSQTAGIGIKLLAIRRQESQ